MANDLQRLMRAVKVIAKLASKYRAEDVAAALMKHRTRREREDVYLVGSYLDEVSEINRKPENEAEGRCCECGGNIYDGKDAELVARGDSSSDFTVRSDARYCSAKCRQRAHRKRVMANCSASDRSRNEAASGDGSCAEQTN